METNKVSIIGAGQVGSAIAFALMEENLASEIAKNCHTISYRKNARTRPT